MKKQKHIDRKTRPPEGKASASTKPVIGIPARRVWLFRIFAGVLGPLLVIGGVELGLRFFGYGYPTDFFLRTTIQGKEYYVPNDLFGYRFFPPALARTPLSLRMAVRKPADTYRIFLFGESAAQGDPEPSFGAGRYLQALLRERYPGTDFEIICVAMTAINSHVILPIARECAQMNGDLWIIYMGNNEMVGPFGASTVFGSREPPAALVQIYLALKATRTGQLLASLMQQWIARAPAPKAWSGLNMFKENQLHYDDPDRLRAYDNFKNNLADILRAGRGADVPVILNTVGTNLKDCAPFASLHRRTLTKTQMSQWDRFFQEGIALETAGSYQNALGQFAQASAIDSQHAELRFRMGSCDLALTNADQALREFELARDHDALDFRADARINQIINNAAAARAGKGVYFLDAARMLAQNSPAKIPGNELFYDHVHLNFAGNYLLGRAIAEQTAKLLPKSILARGKNEWMSAEACDRRLAVSPWDRYGVWQESFGRVAVPPFTDQLNNARRARFYMSVLNDLGPQMNAAAEKESRVMYKDALSRNPDDYFLRDNFAQFLSETGDLTGAVQEEQRVGELLPQTPLPLYKIGRLLVQLGKISEAAESFSRALKIRNDYTPALNELALILANQQKTAAAEQAFNLSLRMNPGLVDAYLDWGFIEQNAGKLDQAIAHYLDASELQPSGPAAWFYHAVVAAREHQRTDAVNDFNAAVWMKPGFWQARYLLGMELAAMGKIEEAQAQFSQVVRIRPDFARAHLNDGVALARQGKLEDALKEFQATLRLNPGDKIAQQNLEAVQRDIQLHKDHGQ